MPWRTALDRPRRLDRRGVAAVEFALSVPFLLILLAGVSDFPLALWDRIALTQAVSGGANYAFAVAQNASSGGTIAVSVSDVQAAVQAASSLSPITVTVGQPTSSCVAPASGALPPTLVAASGSCPDGSAPGTYVTITAGYNYTPLMPFYSMLASDAMTETAIVRLK